MRRSVEPMRPLRCAFSLPDPRFALHSRDRSERLRSCGPCSARPEKAGSHGSRLDRASRSETRERAGETPLGRPGREPWPRAAHRLPAGTGRETRKIENLRRAECYLPDIHAAAENVREAEGTSRGRGSFLRRASAVLTSSARSTRHPRY